MKKVTNRVMWIFAMGQLGWAILSGIVVNWLVYHGGYEVVKLLTERES